MPRVKRLPFGLFLGDEEHPEVDEGKGDVEPEDGDHRDALEPHATGREIEHDGLDDPAKEEETEGYYKWKVDSG